MSATTISKTHTNNMLAIILVVIAVVIYAFSAVVGMHWFNGTQMDAAISGVCVLSWLVFTVQVLMSMVWDEDISGKKPAIINGYALLINIAHLVMVCVAFDQQDIGYAFIGFCIGIPATALLARFGK